MEIRDRLTSGTARICRVRHASLVAGARIRPDAQLVAERAAAQREDLRYLAGGRLLCLTSLVRELRETALRLIDDQMRATPPFDAL
jgi:hypothetical protein